MNTHTHTHEHPGVLHYQWSRTPSLLNDPFNKIIAGMINATLWASSAWYTKHGVKDSAVVVALSAALHGAAVLKQIM